MLMPTATRSCGGAGAPDTVADLLARASENDPAAWDELIRRYDKLIATTVRSFRLQDADARDATQTTWLRLAENTHRILCPDRLSGWLATTARNECLRLLRHTTPTPEPLHTMADTLPDPTPNPEQHVLNADTAHTLWTLVDELSPRQRTLLRALFTDHPQPYTDLARTAGIPPGAIGPTRKRALRQLRGKLNEHGLGRWPGDDNRYRVPAACAV